MGLTNRNYKRSIVGKLITERGGTMKVQITGDTTDNQTGIRLYRCVITSNGGYSSIFWYPSESLLFSHTMEEDYE